MTDDELNKLINEISRELFFLIHGKIGKIIDEIRSSDELFYITNMSASKMVCMIIFLLHDTSKNYGENAPVKIFKKIFEECFDKTFEIIKYSEYVIDKQESAPH